MNRRETREEAVKVVYSMDINKIFENSFVEQYMENFQPVDMDSKYLDKLIQNIIQNINLIDEYIEKNSKDWKIKRIAKMDLAILRISICELLFDDTIPHSVSINEAIEISKKYSNEDSHKYINGILGAVVRCIEKK